MANGLKYTSGDITREGVVYRLNIYQRGYEGEPLEIGDLQALTLEVQGASGGVDQPIVKTSLHFTMADSVDIGVVDGVKHGGWEEFYTPDETLYRVTLQRGGINIWSGYITPDSWSEPLTYRGSITVTARDNIGHMRDFQFSKAALLEGVSYLGGDEYNRVRDENLVSVYGLIYSAFHVAGVGMPLRIKWDEDDQNAEPHLMSGTHDVMDWLVDIGALQDMDWYQVVEKVLVSTGLTIRYWDRDSFYLASLRALHKTGNVTPPTFDVNFVNRSGYRRLDPAYKQIVEKLNYDADEGYEARWEGNDFEVTSRTIEGMLRYVSALTSSSDWTQNDNTREVLRYANPQGPIGSDVAQEADKYVLVAGRPVTAPTPTVGPADDYAKRIAYIDLSNFATSPRKRLSPNTIVSVGFEVAHSYSNAGSSTGFTHLSPFLPCGAIRYALLWKKTDGTYLSLVDSGWEQGVSVREVAIPAGDPNEFGGVDKGAMEAFTVSETFQTPDVPGGLELRLYPFRIDMVGPVFQEGWLDAHVRLGNITFDINSEAVPRYFKTTTVYDETQNYTLKRDVDFGAVPTRFSTAGTIRNGFYEPDAQNGYPSIMNCHWAGDNVELPLPVLNHLQILSLHAKANNILTGELRDASGTPIRWDGNWYYAGRKFLLVSGTWNILTGRVQDAMLREFDTYAEAIGSIQADYSTDLSGGDARLMALQKSVNAAASAAKGAGESGGGGGGGGSTVAISNLLSSGSRIGTLTIDGTAHDIKASVVALSNLNTSGDRIATITLNGTAYDIKAPQYSLVSVRDRLTSGTKIATLQINLNSYDLYAPESLVSVDIEDLLSQGFEIGNLIINGVDNYILIPPPDVSISGTAAAPKVKVEMGNGNSDEVALPVASSSRSGIVSTSAQTFAGAKTFDRIYLGNSEARGAYIEWDDTNRAFKVVGNIYASGQVAAGQ